MPQTAFQYGGQAVIEGVMMRGPASYAVAVRKQDGQISLKSEAVASLSQRYPFLKWPLVRGVVALAESMIVGVQTLTYSANESAGEEEEQLSAREIFWTVLLAVGLAALLFIVIPSVAAHFLTGLSPFWQNMAEGLVRIGIFLIYVVAISRMPDIARVFQYHGAEHKVIHTLEAGEPLTVEFARGHSTLHPRCGTSFLLLVMVLTILIYSFLNTPQLWWRIVSRLLLLPVVAGISYELLKFSGRHADSVWLKWSIAPGLWLQKLTTREPDDSQLEVAIFALQSVLPPLKA